MSNEPSPIDRAAAEAAWRQQRNEPVEQGRNQEEPSDTEREEAAAIKLLYIGLAGGFGLGWEAAFLFFGPMINSFWNLMFWQSPTLLCGALILFLVSLDD